MADDVAQQVRRSWWSYLPKAKSVFLVLSITGLLLTNVATLVSARAHDWLHSLLWQTLTVYGEASAVHLMRNSKQAQIEAEVKVLNAHNLKLSKSNLKLNQQLDLNGKQAKATVATVQQRLAKGVARNVAALPIEAIPYLGLGVTVAVTSLDIYDACATMKDFNALLRMMGQYPQYTALCNQTVPTVDQVLASTKALGFDVPPFCGKN